MGVRLIVEVLDHWQDAGLTAGERNDLLVLAENANDKSRLTWGPVHEPYILRRVGKTTCGWKNSIGKLIKKGALIQHVQGYVGQAAVYRLALLCPESPHDGWKGHCTRPERVTPQVTLSGGENQEGHLSGDPVGNPSGDPFDQEGHLRGVERVTPQVTPTPPVSSLKIPSKTSSSLVADVSSTPDAAGVADTSGGGGGSPFDQDQDRDTTSGTSVEQGPTGVGPSEQQAEPLVAALDYRGRPPGNKQRAQLVALIAAALAAGWSEQDLKTYLDLGGAAVNSAAAVYVHRLDPGELPDPAAFREAQQRPLEGTDAIVAGWGALSRQLAAHKPFDGGGWDRIRQAASSGDRPDGWEKYPHCGDPGCDEITRMREERDWQGTLAPSPCTKCHPEMRF